MKLDNDRFVSVINPKQEEHHHSPQKFSKFLDKPNIILLGAPGAGKSHLFNSTAKYTNTRCLKVRQFLNLPKMDTDTEIFIDALDESRNGRGDDRAIDNMVKKLFAQPIPKCRISCRESDWLGDTDLGALNDYFELNGGVTVLRLGVLSEREQIQILQQNGIDNPIQFISDARLKGVEQFLDNPQSLIMLSQVVKNYDWPETKQKLFSQTAEILLREHNIVKRSKDMGSYSAEDLLPIAGAIMASRLISGVDGVSLDTESNELDYPSFKTLDCLDTERVQETLRRRLFINTSDENIVDYCHRTIAEYLAALWISERIRNGLPIKRAMSLFGLDGYPTSELRGLNAWLPIFLPEYAERFIKVDPYGVLLYGEAKSLTPCSRKLLLNHLGKLAITEPWYRQYMYENDYLSGLICNQLVDAVIPILISETTHYSFRVLILEALAEGEYILELEEACYEVLGLPDLTYIEHRAALGAISKFPEPNKARLKSFFDASTKSETDVRLKADMLSFFYGKVLHVEDFINTLMLALQCKEEVAGGWLWKLELIPTLVDIPAILDTVLVNKKYESYEISFHSNDYDVGAIYQSLLERYLTEVCPISITDLTYWLTQNNIHSHVFTSGFNTGTEKSNEILATNKRNFTRMLVSYFLTFDIKVVRQNGLYKVFKLTEGLVSEGSILLILTEQLTTNLDDERQELLYSFAIELLGRSQNVDAQIFNYLLDYPQNVNKPKLGEIAEQYLFHEYPEWEIKSKQRKIEQSIIASNTKKLNVENILATKTEIEEGRHLSKLSWLASLYYAKFRDVEKEGNPRDRIINYFAGYDTSFIFRGFKALLQRDDLPTVDDILKLQIESKYQEWWYPVLAGFDETWQDEPSLKSWSNVQKTLGLTLHRKLHTLSYEGNHGKSMIRKWIEKIHIEYPDLSAQAYFFECDYLIQHGEKHLSALSILLRQAELKEQRPKYILQLLANHPNCNDLNDTLAVALREFNHDIKLQTLVDLQVDENHEPINRSFYLWLVAGLLVNPEKYQAQFEVVALKHRDLIWALKDLCNQAMELFESLPEQTMFSLTKVSAYHFKNVHNPKSSMGDRNDFNGADFVKKLINKLSSTPTKLATEFLTKLLKDDDLATYKENLQQALANQHKIFREHNFRKPTWKETLSSLFNLEPSNIADLQSLVMEHLLGIASDINSNNTDIYKQFWNEDQYGKITKPKVEESCRHVLLELLRHRLNPLSIISEPEGHMYKGKRADIVCLINDFKLPIEIKRDNHDEIWFAAESQLFKFYMKDPVISGKGIYLIFWFGENRKGNVKCSPSGLTPSTAIELKKQLVKNLSDFLKNHIEVMVIDVSGN